MLRGTWPMRFLLFPVGIYRRLNEGNTLEIGGENHNRRQCRQDWPAIPADT
jgi:hypothetical protein